MGPAAPTGKAGKAPEEGVREGASVRPQASRLCLPPYSPGPAPGACGAEAEEEIWEKGREGLGSSSAVNLPCGDRQPSQVVGTGNDRPP